MTRVCVFEGDDAAPEAVRPTVDLLERLDVGLEFVVPPVAAHADTLAEGELPGELRREIDDADTVLFGAASDTHGPIIGYLRREYGGGLPANVRPVTYYEGVDAPLKEPEGIDYTIVRENLDGVYGGVEGDLADLVEAVSGLPGTGGIGMDDWGEGYYAIRKMRESNVRWFARFACDLAADRAGDGTATITCATKSNVLPKTDGLLQDVVEETAAEYGSLSYEHLHADDLGQQLVIDPGRFDVIATPNLAGDILSDVGAGTVGGLGFAPSGCYGEDHAYFEPVHGTAPDIAGDGSINPTATILSAAMMLDYLGLGEAADRLENAVAAVYAEGEALTPDQGGSASTAEMAGAVAGRL